MTGGRAETAPDWLETARGRCDPQALDRLWAAVPEPMRLSRFAESTVPPQYAGAFCHDGTWRGGVDLSHLPDPMRREVAWSVFQIITLGRKIPTPTLSMLVRRLGEAIADRTDQTPVSLLVLSDRDWCQAIGHAVHRRTGRLPAATTMKNIRTLLTGIMRLLVTALDTGPWWHLDQWNPTEDTRIPLRDHEPMGRYSVRFDRIGIPWLRGDPFDSDTAPDQGQRHRPHLRRCLSCRRSSDGPSRTQLSPRPSKADSPLAEIPAHQP